MRIEQSVSLNCSPETAFAAFTSADSILSWWGDDQSYRVREWESHMRCGGKWHARFETNAGQSFGVSGEYLDFDPPRLIEWTWRADWEQTPKLLRMEFESDGAGTKLRAISQADYNEQMQAEDMRGLSEIVRWFAQHCNTIK